MIANVQGGCAKHGQGFRSQNLKRNDILIANVQEEAWAQVKNLKRTKPKSFITAVQCTGGQALRCFSLNLSSLGIGN